MIPVMSHTSSRNIVQVVISGPLRKVFDYRMPETHDNYHVGCRVLIPFGPKQRVAQNAASAEAKTKISGFPDPDKDYQYYLNRYENEPSYQDWFHNTFPGLTVYEAVC